MNLDMGQNLLVIVFAISRPLSTGPRPDASPFPAHIAPDSLVSIYSLMQSLLTWLGGLLAPQTLC